MVSDECKSLIKRMLVVDPVARIKGEEALKDPWILKYKRNSTGVNGTPGQGPNEDAPLDPNILKSMKEYKGVSALKKAAMNILVKMADNKDIEKLREAFIAMDLDATGDIQADELKIALKNANFNFSDEEIDSIINEVDYGGDRIINYTEFLAATISVK